MGHRRIFKFGGWGSWEDFSPQINDHLGEEHVMIRGSWEDFRLGGRVHRRILSLGVGVHVILSS